MGDWKETANNLMAKAHPVTTVQQHYKVISAAQVKVSCDKLSLYASVGRQQYCP